MAELTSGLTSVVFSPYSKMFIGGLSWQTSPGETGILFYSMSRDFLLFCVAVDWVLVCRLASACLPAWCLLWRCMCECAPYCMGYLTRVCAHDVIFDLRPSEVLYSTPKRIAGCFFSFSVCVCVCVLLQMQWQQHAHMFLSKWPDIFSLSFFYPQTALETILVNSEK